jgi:hypothetical protein
MLLYAMQRGRRDFATVTTLQPRHYDIVADVGVAQRALQLLKDPTEGTRTWPPQ